MVDSPKKGSESQMEAHSLRPDGAAVQDGRLHFPHVGGIFLLPALTGRRA